MYVEHILLNFDLFSDVKFSINGNTKSVVSI